MAIGELQQCSRSGSPADDRSGTETVRTTLNERVDELNAVDRARRSHVFLVQGLNTRVFARSQNHAVPMREAVSGRQF